MQEAVNVVIELISLSKKDRYSEIRNFVFSNIESLQSHVLQVLQVGDCDRANMFSEIFVELALT